MILEGTGVDGREVESSTFDIPELLLLVIQDLESVYHILQVASDEVELADGSDWAWELSEDFQTDLVIYGHFPQQCLEASDVGVVELHLLVLVLVDQGEGLHEVLLLFWAIGTKVLVYR